VGEDERVVEVASEEAQDADREREPGEAFRAGRGATPNASRAITAAKLSTIAATSRRASMGAFLSSTPVPSAGQRAG
jgi:hypothetical protein